ncbi:glucan endo-1-3-beta-glucosidase eglC [Penicillium diatomitis]|uniref:Probable glucan endo-1,3-beta-glucosidase eglC n=1 Tax=Penicillium diatomitis TaxID=2819901 RepID=A0A9W9X5E5_9EURO|nr:glucan endo-1-3-beta-glucosidase eglC [Penicillium diatomitis]KAJ5484033.1 glucan endo-1-3-beta-glucosidase eglC [Penicillium diatomitis]
MFSKQAIALAFSVAAAQAAHQGFNYGSTLPGGGVAYEADFKTQFQTAKNLVGTSGFTSARLYTMIQGGTTNEPIQAIPAAIAEETSLLLGLWASGGNIDNEIAALQSAISTYGDAFGKLVVGISVGSEDLYRNSVTGAKNHAGIGLNPDVLVEYIKKVKAAIAGTPLSGASIGHVDTWDAWTNGTNAAVINEIDWLGFDGYPYFQTTMPNGIDQGKALFDDAVAKTKSVAQGKEVWITETGWPVSGPTENEAVASVANAKQYWDQVGCPLFGETNTWWYILADAGASPSFGISSSISNTQPLFDLSCKSSSSSSSSAASSATNSAVNLGAGHSTATSAAASSTSTGSNSGSGSGSSGSGSSGSGSSGSGSSGSGSSGSGSSGSGSSDSGSSMGGHSTTMVSVPAGQTPTSASSTPLISSAGTPSSSAAMGSSGASTTGSASGSSGAGAGSSGTSASGSSSGSAAGSSSSASSSPYVGFNSAARSSGSAFSALAAALVLAIAL